MECIVQDKIQQISADVSVYVVKTEQEIVDNFLDKVNASKKRLTEDSEQIEALITALEELTWLDRSKFTPEDFLSTRNLIEALKGLHSSWIRWFVKQKTAAQKYNVAKDELKLLKHSLDDLREITHDYEFIFFKWPHDPDWIATEEEISKLS